jgi:cell division septum initiation protein DivIVA
MDIQKELEKVQEENHKLFQMHQELLKQVANLEQKIQQNNGVIIFLKEHDNDNKDS